MSIWEIIWFLPRFQIWSLKHSIGISLQQSLVISVLTQKPLPPSRSVIGRKSTSVIVSSEQVKTGAATIPDHRQHLYESEEILCYYLFWWTTKTHISLHICAGWYEFLLFTSNNTFYYLCSVSSDWDVLSDIPLILGYNSQFLLLIHSIHVSPHFIQ